MKILDRYILTTYLKTFLSVFIILMFIFVLQAIWLYIGDLAGKDLDTFIIVKLLLYLTPTLIPLILPLTILVVSIMVFGQFAENYEFAAMKSTGISLQRAMKSLSVFIVLLGIITFFFSNNVIPWANYNVYNLRKNIAQVKPALAIAKGQFNEIGTYNIKVEDKTGENGQFLKNVVIHKKAASNSKNRTVIISESGELKSSENSNILQLVLYNGHYYEEIFSRKPSQTKKKPYAKSYFEEYTINVDLEGLNDVDIDDKSYDNRYNMLDVNALNFTIDSLYKQKSERLKTFSNTLYNRTSAAKLNDNISPKQDSIFKGDDLISIFNNRTKVQLLNLAQNTINSTKQIISTNKQNFTVQTKWRNKHVQSLHDKYVLGLACIILFFVGAPLGALIRKGGIGLPLVIAILLFLTYHFIGIFAKNSSLDDSVNPIAATWLSTIIMLPLSIYLTRRATKDRPLFESEGLLEPMKKLFGIKSKTLSYDRSLLDVNSEAYQTLNSYDNDKLIDVLKHYREYDYSIEYKNSSLALLNARGITEQQLKFAGNLTDHSYEESIRLKYLYEENSKLAFVLYALSLLLILPGAVLRNNGFPTTGSVLFFAGIGLGVIYLFALIKSFIDHANLYKQLEKNSVSNALVFVLFGLPLYAFIYFYQKKKIKEDLKLSAVKKQTIVPNASQITNIKGYSDQLKDYKAYSKFALIFYCIGVVLFVLYLVFKNNKLPAAESASIELSAVSGFLFMIYTVITSIHYNSLQKLTEQHNMSKHMLWTVLSIVFYPVVYFLRRNKINKDVSA
ncbi:lipopolysaccharide export system permease protein [Formosa sp. Hel1_31_208]|uniref:LptF/LptG family permease n=1 Tax=Formosa sp. Hel1_31_208 TaxID=1798225 RepID=UPI00087D846F|nr:LptF/LptG family permease [Formosa sp. Hel1_31_208]SDS19740.1 lipopolysaccharide export system permease protein [Formosa sp. Hel1_31_208]